jgi:hypothetical protein
VIMVFPELPAVEPMNSVCMFSSDLELPIDD